MSVSVFTYEYGEKRTFVPVFMYVTSVWMSLSFRDWRIAFVVSSGPTFSCVAAETSGANTFDSVFSPVHAFHPVCVREHACRFSVHVSFVGCVHQESKVMLAIHANVMIFFIGGNDG